jgi:YD repeat-containing protein
MSSESSGFLAALQANGTVRMVYTKPVDDVALGNFLQIQADGTSIISGADGQVLRVVRPTGHVFEYRYDDFSMRLIEITFPDKSVWRLFHDRKWFLLGRDGHANKQLNFTPSVDQDGTLWLRDSQGFCRQYVYRIR